MKIPCIATFLLFAVPFASALDSFNCGDTWIELALRRYSIFFRGYCVDKAGQCFLDNLRGQGLWVHNWQAWDTTGDGLWRADFSVALLNEHEVNEGLAKVLKFNPQCWIEAPEPTARV